MSVTEVTPATGGQGGAQVTTEAAVTTTAATTETATTTAATTEAPKPFYSDFKNPELRGYAEKKAFPDAETAVQSYMNLEKFHGVPAEKLLKLPDEFTPETTKPILEKLGYVAPKEAKEYGFADMEGADAAEASMLQDIAFKHGVPQNVAQAVFKDVIAQQAAARTALLDAITNEAAAEMGALRAKYPGAKYDEFIEKGRRAAREIAGISQEELEAIETNVGAGRTMEIMATIFDRAGKSEAAFVAGNPGKGFNGMTPEGARAEIQSLRNDREFFTRLMNGNAEAKRKWDGLNAVAASDMQVSQ